MKDELSERNKKILEAIIEDYIVTAEPVGSRAVTRRHGLALSPASVRNVMADLEEMGFLASPHTSAGRVPTDKAYRFYVDSLLTVRRIDKPERELIRKQYNAAGRDIGAILHETSRMLSSVSRYTGIVLAPRFSSTIFRHIEFVKLSGRRILTVLVAQNGSVQNRLIESEEEFATEDLVRMSNYLNELLEGLPVAQVRTRILEEMKGEKALYDSLIARALVLSEQTLEEEGAQIFIEGQTNIFEQPEFADVGRMKTIFRAFEEKGHLVDLLDRCINAQGVQIFIGAETHLNRMEGLSVVTSTYLTGKNTLGVLGVIGPTRMGYAKVIPIVDYTAKLVSRLLEET
ncbi:heat-inducible transcription repressor HrcA [Geotalea uraniireducens]|uniref:Heat-inducible transcription repressor HrcA n=1 Tax=Geotalea uraniireducens TaxID=351604 RepID=A0ABN6VSF9_9BACT|nr:heat-inducible transcriptional repressor HrcA [Geotalea uraniireducens]BDV41112.1 heat-inducible transcription repressor HrcA [Geotalea uraniireducens]